MEIQIANIRLVLFIIIIASVTCINRPVYKVSLTQKGFAQVGSFSTIIILSKYTHISNYFS